MPPDTDPSRHAPNGPAPPAVPAVPEAQLQLPMFTPPTEGELITSTVTGNTYRIGSLIGEGSFGVVFQCTDTWQNNLAVKVLKPLGSYDAIKAGAIGEFQKLQLLRHPFITYVHDAFEYRHTFYIVCEHCWQPISQFIQREDFAGGYWLKAIARCVLQGVHFIHINGYAHQDLHAGNVFVSWIADEMTNDQGAFTFKVGDLGISKLVSEMNPDNTILAEWMRAPESIDPKEYGVMDHRMDIYHCGLLFLQVLQGKPLTFSTEQVLAGEPRRVALELGSPFSFSLEKALRRHVDYRTASAMELWRDLNTPLAKTP